MFKLYKKDGSEVTFSTEEGMNKTLEAFSNKYSKEKPVIEDVEIPVVEIVETPEPVIEDVPVSEIPADVTVENGEDEEMPEAAE